MYGAQFKYFLIGAMHQAQCKHNLEHTFAVPHAVLRSSLCLEIVNVHNFVIRFLCCPFGHFLCFYGAQTSQFLDLAVAVEMEYNQRPKPFLIGV